MPERDGLITSRELCVSGTPARVIDDGSIGEEKLKPDAAIPGSKLEDPLVVDTLQVNTIENQTGTVSVAANVGTLLDGGYQTSTTAPGTSNTDLITVTVTLDYPGQPVVVFANAGMSTTSNDENERYQGFIEIDGAPGETMYQGEGNVTSSSAGGHVHNDVSGDVSGVSASDSHSHVVTSGTLTADTSVYHATDVDVTGAPGIASDSHSHTSGTYAFALHNHGLDGAHSHTVSVSDSRTSLACRNARSYTPTGATVSIKLRGLRSGTLGGWQHDMTYQVFRNG
jgi:hypothetical protein